MVEAEFHIDFASQELTSLTEEGKKDVQRADPMSSGFLWYEPPMAAESVTDGQHWIISGHDMQVLTTTLPPGETIVTEVGSFFFGSHGITTEVEFTLCSDQGCQKGWDRVCGGESCVKVFLNNSASEPGYVGLTPNYPAKIIPIKVS
jgi:hypothetical protein